MWQRFWFRFLQFLGRDPRGIFRFWDGRRWRLIDPISAARSLMSHPTFRWDKHPIDVTSSDVDVASNAIRTCAEAVTDVFGIDGLENDGLTEAERCNVLWAFQDYLASVKKNGSGPQTSPPPLDQPPRFPGDGFPTRPESDSGSTPTEPEAVLPGT